MHRCPPPSEPSPLAAPPEALYGGQLETLRLALAGIIEHRLRALLTALGVVFGVMSVIAVTAIVQGFFACTPPSSRAWALAS